MTSAIDGDYGHVRFCGTYSYLTPWRHGRVSRLLKAI